jgi:23S rRNA (cytosine1962-C5)-methyltransferase
LIPQSAIKNMGLLTLTSKGFAWFRKGHPWIFRDDLEKIQDAAPGAVVILEKKNGEFAAQGFYSDRSKIAFRLVSRERGAIDREFWKGRLQQAARFREAVVQKANACRLVYAESDGIPSLIVDRYANHLVMQTLSQGADHLAPLFAELLSELFQPSSLIVRNDLAVRDLEGLPQEKKVILGTLPGRIEVQEGDIRYWVDPWTGQKTGAYLDQRENRIRAGTYLRGKVLDAFCYQGLFGLHAARSATRVTCLDSSPEALERAAENARLNGLENLEFRRENAFDFLKAEVERGNRYDGINLDPPAFARSRGDVDAAARGYRELNLRAMRLLNPGGVLVASSCSYNLSESRFIEILKESAGDAKADLRIIEKRGQSADHPVLLTFPESYYLKCLILEKAF